MARRHIHYPKLIVCYKKPNVCLYQNFFDSKFLKSQELINELWVISIKCSMLAYACEHWQCQLYTVLQPQGSIWSDMSDRVGVFFIKTPTSFLQFYKQFNGEYEVKIDSGECSMIMRCDLVTFLCKLFLR